MRFMLVRRRTEFDQFSNPAQTIKSSLNSFPVSVCADVSLTGAGALCLAVLVRHYNMVLTASDDGVSRVVAPSEVPPNNFRRGVPADATSVKSLFRWEFILSV
jgi:hypothetical protein